LHCIAQTHHRRHPWLEPCTSCHPTPNWVGDVLADGDKGSSGIWITEQVAAQLQPRIGTLLITLLGSSQRFPASRTRGSGRRHGQGQRVTSQIDASRRSIHLGKLPCHASQPTIPARAAHSCAHAAIQCPTQPRHRAWTPPAGSSDEKKGSLGPGDQQPRRLPIRPQDCPDQKR